MSETRPKVVFIGNCQAQAFESLCGHLGVEVDVIAVPPIWEINEDSSGFLADSLMRADFIFSQRLSEDYSLELIRNGVLQDRYGEKVIVWPNIYFDGYFPGIRYLYNDYGKIVGPLADYHFQWIIDSWRDGSTVEETALLAHDLSVWKGDVDFVEQSTNQLKSREKRASVNISDYIVNNFRRKKLFYTMNHPVDEVLVEMLARLFQKAGVPFSSRNSVGYPYTLNQIIIPEFRIFRERYKPIFEESCLFKGVESPTDVPASLHNERSYSFRSLIEAYFALYDQSR
ncbi:WcbI family polysaccharide biosynthesis putative acetyltransferase [Rhizobium lusitanum]|uniref:Polysaccharide biosynthesis enzyme WcbI domain-containing protein n=1 Tax=Rhizobium lusitanum TaxID=293958 RepID=A0A7X0IVD6_9HYPH|nr:WcbI family polysaccharide biosynthesis putative acetyltransferase [Rhizobium lusitanum]MBB6486707.1 hypothetical protein [Rhizobium lusitanum]